MSSPTRHHRTPLALACGMAMVTLAAGTQASSHREAPFITETPKVDATDLYAFRSYEPGREAYVTLIANYLICSGAALLLSRWIPKRSLIMATSAGIVFSFLGGLTGWWHLVMMLD